MLIRLFSKTFLALFLSTTLPAFAATTTISQSVANTTEPYLDASKSPDGATASTALGFRVNGTEIMRVTATGSVGIGTTNPGAKVTVYDTGSFNPYPMSFGETRIGKIENAGWGANGICFGNYSITGNTSCIGANGGSFFFGTFSSTANYASPMVLTSVGNLAILGALTQNSDLRLKRDVAPITDALEKIASVHGVTFRWKDAEKDPAEQMGVIAQEIRPLFPQLVSEDKDGILSVNYPGLTAPLIEAVKELKAENDILRARLEKLEAQIAP